MAGERFLYLLRRDLDAALGDADLDRLSVFCAACVPVLAEQEEGRTRA